MEDDRKDTFDQLHVPYIDTPYGGLTYQEVRTQISQSQISKLYTYGFHDSQSIDDCVSAGGRVGKVVSFI